MLTFVYHLLLWDFFTFFASIYICLGAKIQTTYTMIFHFMLINALVYDVDSGKFSNLHFFVWMFSALLILWSSYLVAVKVLSRRLEVKCHCISTTYMACEWFFDCYNNDAHDNNKTFRENTLYIRPYNFQINFLRILHYP